MTKPDLTYTCYRVTFEVDVVGDPADLDQPWGRGGIESRARIALEEGEGNPEPRIERLYTLVNGKRQKEDEDEEEYIGPNYWGPPPSLRDLRTCGECGAPVLEGLRRQHDLLHRQMRLLLDSLPPSVVLPVLAEGLNL
jgi:hypothetical protein